MRKPIIVFSLVMMLAPLPTLIPWIYNTWSSDKDTPYSAAYHGKFRTTGYPSMLDDTPWLMSGTATNLNDTAAGDIVRGGEWECPGLRDKKILLTNSFYY